MRLPVLVCIATLALVDGAKKKKSVKKDKGPKAEFKLWSPNFGNGQELPLDMRWGEDNVSPPFNWTGTPKNTQSFVFIVDSENPRLGKDGVPRRDTHWVIYDIPSEVDGLKEELSDGDKSDVVRLGMKDDAGTAPVVVDPMGSIDGWVDPEITAMQKMIHGAIDASFEEKNRAKEGLNSFGMRHYRGPSEKGSELSFKLYALSARLDLDPGASKQAVKEAMKGKVLGKTTVTGVI